MIVEDFPAIDDFYQNYWGKRPFVVKGAIDRAVFDGLICGDELAALSLEDDVRSRLITSTPQSEGNVAWNCSHGPFDENMFASLGNKQWSLLVQNVEQFHTGTADLLKSFDFAPRWLMDDIMISYSSAGGGVGAHTDSYHVFLVQGQGKRRWRISREAIEQCRMVQSDGLLMLDEDFVGDEYEVEMGDVIYIPPHFAHEGVTLADAMTFSVGFLGPKLSELFVEYGQYLEQQDEMVNMRYVGQGLDGCSAGRVMSEGAVGGLQHALSGAFETESFSRWLTQYFSLPTHADRDDVIEEEEHLDSAALKVFLEQGGLLAVTSYAKAALVRGDDNAIQYMAVYGDNINLDESSYLFIRAVESGAILSWKMIEEYGGFDRHCDLIIQLCNKQYLERLDDV